LGRGIKIRTVRAKSTRILKISRNSTNGVAQQPIEGVSMPYTWDKANANAKSTRTTQYFEMFGNRAIYNDGWIAATTPPEPPWLMGTAKMPDVINGYKWELYNIAEDYSDDSRWFWNNEADSALTYVSY
jgi:arylsulfatase A-like enzyme